MSKIGVKLVNILRIVNDFIHVINELMVKLCKETLKRGCFLKLIDKLQMLNDIFNIQSFLIL